MKRLRYLWNLEMYMFWSGVEAFCKQRTHDGVMRKKKGRMMTAEERQSLYYMKSALIWHYKRKYPENEALITEICEMVGSLLGAQEPQGGGGVGMIRGWEELIQDIEEYTLPR